jgi:hypothetical protein
MRQIGQFLFEERAGIIVDPDGGRHTLRSQLCSLLCLFLAAPNHSVSANAIQASLWPGTTDEDKSNDVHVSVRALRRCFGKAGDALLPRGVKGYYQLVLPPALLGNVNEPQDVLTVEQILQAQETGRLTPIHFHHRTEVAIHAHQFVELRRPQQFWTNLLLGVAYHVYFGRGNEHLAVDLLQALYIGANPSKEEWEMGMGNLRLRFLAGRQSPHDVILFNVQDHQDAVVYLRGPGDAAYRRGAQAMEYWRWLDESPAGHRWHAVWVEPPLDTAGLLSTLCTRAKESRLPRWAWQQLFDSVQRKAPGRARTSSRATLREESRATS